MFLQVFFSPYGYISVAKHKPHVSSFWEHPESASLVLIICSSVSLESGFYHLQQQLPPTWTHALLNQGFFAKFRHFTHTVASWGGQNQKEESLLSGLCDSCRTILRPRPPPAQPARCHCRLLTIFIMSPATSALKAQGQSSDWGLKRSLYYLRDNETRDAILAGTRGENVRNVLTLQLAWVILMSSLPPAAAFNPFR